MITMQLSFQGTEVLRRAFAEQPAMAKAELLATVERLVDELAASSQNRWPRDTGNSAQSIVSDAYSTPAGVLGTVTSPRPEVAFIELGTRPHWAPIRPLHEWVQRRLGLQGDHAWAVAKAIQKKIAARGTQARAIFQAVLADNQAVIGQRLENATARIAARLQGDAGASA